MISVNSNNIRISRGNTAYIDISVKVNGEDYELQSGDKVIFTVKKTPSKSADIVFQKVIDGRLEIKILPSDTADLLPAKYYYDVALQTSGGDFYTFIEPSGFTICATNSEVISDG